MAVHDYIRQRFFPHMWCPGCGHGMLITPTNIQQIIRVIQGRGM